MILAEAENIAESEAELRALKAVVRLPVVLLGSGEQSAIVRTLLAGADAYLPWSSEPALLLSHLRALLRRATAQAKSYSIA
jgi:DNA-binding response OmpR family regulator